MACLMPVAHQTKHHLYFLFPIYLNHNYSSTKLFIKYLTKLWTFCDMYNNHMKLGGHVSVAGGLLNAVDKTQEIDANCIQIFSSPPRNLYGPNHSENAIAEFNEEVDKQSLRPIFIHATYLTNLASINPQTRVNSIKMLKAELEFGDKIRAAGIIFHIGSHKDQTHEVGIKLVIAGVKEILRNNYQTPLLLENAAGENNKIGSDLKDLETISSAVNNPHLGYCLDTAHLYSAGYDLSNPSTINSILQ